MSGETQESFFKKHKRGIITAGAVLGASGVVAAGIAATADGGEPGPDTSNKPTAEATYVAPETPDLGVDINSPEAEPTSVNLEPLSVEKFSTPEDLMFGFENGVINDHFMSGTESITLDQITASGSDISAFVESVAAPLDDKFAETYLVSNWREIPALVEMMNRIHGIHARTIEYFIKTGGVEGMPKNALDQAPYSTYAEIVEGSISSTATGSGPDTQWDVVCTVIESDNADANRVDEDFTNNIDIFDNNPSTGTYTWVQENGNWVLSNINKIG